MLMIHDLKELKQHLEYRRDMAKNHASTGSSARKAELDDTHKRGMVAAFNEAIDAVQCLFEYIESTKD